MVEKREKNLRCYKRHCYRRQRLCVGEPGDTVAFLCPWKDFYGRRRSHPGRGHWPKIILIFVPPEDGVLKVLLSIRKKQQQKQLSGQCFLTTKTDNKDKNNTLNTLNAERAPPETCHRRGISARNSRKASDAPGVWILSQSVKKKKKIMK